MLTMILGGSSSAGPAPIVRGTPIDSPPQAGPAGGGSNSVSVGATMPKAPYRLPFSPAENITSPISATVTNSMSAVSATNFLGTCSSVIELKDGYWILGFDTLSAFPARTVLEPMGPKFIGQIPDQIKSLDGKKVALKGFMVPLNSRSGLVIECLLLKSQSMCCYGVPPRINEWVIVRIPAGVKSIMDRPVTIYGRLSVGEYLQDQRLRAIYQLEGEKMDEPADK
jgi:hypothetical protein